MVFSKRTFLIILVDLVGISLSNLFLFLVLDANVNLIFILVSFALLFAASTVTGAYNQLWRYTSFREVQNLFLSNLFSFSFLTILNSLNLINISPILLFNFFSFYFLYSILIRGARRFYSLRFKKHDSLNSDSHLNILIIGAGNAASTIVKDVLQDQPGAHICGIIASDPKKIGAQIHGVKVIGALDSLSSALTQFNVQQAIIAMPSASRDIIKSITQQLIRKNISFKVVPHIRDMIDSSMPIHLNNLSLDNLIDDKEFTAIKSNYKSPEKKRVLITGGSGYIGTHLTEMLLKSDYNVVLLDNHLYGNHGIEHLSGHPSLEIVQGDIANIKDVVKSLKNVDTIIALAAIVGDPACGVNPQETLNLNYESSKILVETANFYGVRRLVFASSCSVYGVGGNDLLSENSPLNPVSLYAKTRIMSENILFERSDSVSPVILRLSTVFGYSPRMRFDLVVNLLTVKAIVDKQFQIFGGNQWRPFIHCKDVAKAFYLAATKEDHLVDRQIFNVGSDQLNYQLKDIGTLIKSHVPDTTYEILNENVDERNYRVSFEKIKSQLGFAPDYDLDRGIVEMIEKINASKNLQNYSNKIYSNLETIKSFDQREIS
ncbi:MAG: NAD-dependent epimerase/dehydratase family protein [Candidatus Margulisiibacteriota bacterium]